MAHWNLSLPESLTAFIEEQVAKGGYGSADEYLRSLVQEAQQREAEGRLEALLIEGLDSGGATEANEEFWEQFRARLVERSEKAVGS